MMHFQLTLLSLGCLCVAFVEGNFLFVFEERFSQRCVCQLSTNAVRKGSLPPLTVTVRDAYLQSYKPCILSDSDFPSVGIRTYVGLVLIDTSLMSGHKSKQFSSAPRSRRVATENDSY